MSEAFRLVFAGEIVDGQHAAVVKKRLAGLLKLDDDRMEVLFSGKPVVVKKQTDEKTAVRYTQAFKKAGARLRVLPVEGAEGAAQTAPSPAPKPAESEPSPQAHQGDQSGLSVLPAGSDILTDAERAANEPVPVRVTIDHLEVLDGSPEAVAEQILAELPEVDHLTLAELGVTLSDPAAFDTETAEIIEADFDLAEPGAVLGSAKEEVTALPPDTGHLSLVPEEDEGEEKS